MVLEGFGDCAQLEFLDFARGGFGELLKDHFLGRFEASKFCAGKSDQLFFAGCCAGLQLNKGAGHFAPFVIRLGDYRVERFFF